MTLQRILGNTHGGYSNDIQLHSNRWSSCKCRRSGLSMTQWLSQTRPRHPWPWFIVGMRQGYWRPKLLDASNVPAGLRLNQVATWLELFLYIFSCQVHFCTFSSDNDHRRVSATPAGQIQRASWCIDWRALPATFLWACHIAHGLGIQRAVAVEQQVSDSKWRKPGRLFLFPPFPFSRPALMHWVSS